MSKEFKIYLFIILGLFAALFFWLFSSPAGAQELCGPRRDVIDALKRTAHEKELWVGAHPNEKGTVMLLLSGSAGTWTLLTVKEDVACIIAAGNRSTPLIGDPA